MTFYFSFIFTSTFLIGISKEQNLLKHYNTVPLLIKSILLFYSFCQTLQHYRLNILLNKIIYTHTKLCLIFFTYPLVFFNFVLTKTSISCINLSFTSFPSKYFSTLHSSSDTSSIQPFVLIILS